VKLGVGGEVVVTELLEALELLLLGVEGLDCRDGADDAVNAGRAFGGGLANENGEATGEALSDGDDDRHDRDRGEDDEGELVLAVEGEDEAEDEGGEVLDGLADGLSAGDANVIGVSTKRTKRQPCEVERERESGQTW
jgi:hypothetical protein